MTDDDTMGKEETCAYMRASLGTVDRLMRKGVLQYTREGGRVRVLRASVDAYLRSTWDEYWSTVERLAADGPLPEGAQAARLAKLFEAGQQRSPAGRAPTIRTRDAA